MPPMPLMGQQNNNPFNNDSNKFEDKKKWVNIPARIHFTTIGSLKKQQIDTSILLMYRRLSTHGWYHHLGNYGNAAMDMKFDPHTEPGLRLGYDIFKPYQFQLQDLRYYNTTRPFSQFEYSLGSRQEQVASLLHTQNITRNWNVALLFKNINSQGYFLNQFANYNGGYLTSNFLSENNRYTAKLGVVYNKNRSDENGGITADSFLTMDNIVDRQQIPTVISNIPTAANRSMVLNAYRNVDIEFRHMYRWGVADTLYNEDSTAITPRFTPKFGIQHQFQAKLGKHTFHDRFPNDTRYRFIADSIPFINADTNRNENILNTFENRVSFNGYIGKPGKQASIELGMGNRVDQVKDDVANNYRSTVLLNNFIYGSIRKEALDSFAWSYEADANFYFAGSAVGDLKLRGALSKHIRNIGGFELGFVQSVTSPPLAFTRFATNYYVREYDLNKISTTKVSAGLIIDKIGLSIKGNNILAGNYIYYGSDLQVHQYDNVFNMIQLEGVHDLKLGKYRMYSEALIQQVAGNAPINVPLVLLRHVSAYEDYIFGDKLWFNTGIEVRYHTPYISSGYTPYFNQFYYRSDDEQLINMPEVTAFLSFKVKQFRLFISGDQLQQLIYRKNTMYFPNYPLPDAMFRFGINWIMYN